MSFVKLYVYDLSNGMARQLSQQLIGRHIEGIWHTSVVVFGKEVFYGQGITTTLPGRSHHGKPLQIIDMGETALDEETFNEYLEEIKTHYTADKYHLLDFNCNSFTDDCVGFLTGNSIPPFIKDLPRDFLSTPFGAALRPTIDNMFGRPVPGLPSTVGTSSDSQLSSSILESVASQARPNSETHTDATSSLTGPVHIVTNPATFSHFIKSHRAAVALFTAPQTCPPCRVIEPVFDQLAEERALHDRKSGAAFAKIDLNVGMGRVLATEWGVRATPTFMFFLDGKKIDELKGANANELRTQVNLLLFQAFPPHPHTNISLPAVEALSFNPILFSQAPSLDAVLAKQLSFVDEQSSWPESGQTKDQVKTVVATFVNSYLKPRFPATGSALKDTKSFPANPTTLITWSQTTRALADAVAPESLFPIADLWRLAFLDPAVCSWAASSSPPSHSSNPIRVLLSKAILALDSSSKGSRNYVLIVLRLLCNTFSQLNLAQTILRSEMRDEITAALISSLLHPDGTVRTASASLAFNIAAVLQKDRVDAIKSGQDNQLALDADWEIEVITALVEALKREKENEEVVYRLTAALAFFLRLSHHYESQIRPLLEVLQSQQVLKSKLAKGSGWTTDSGIAKENVRKLVQEVADNLCS